MADVETWNYRVVRKNGLLGIHEAYYDEGGMVTGLSVDPLTPTYDDVTELKVNLELMLSAIDDGIIDYYERGSSTADELDSIRHQKLRAPNDDVG